MTRIARAALAATLAVGLTASSVQPGTPAPTPIEDVQGTAKWYSRVTCMGCAVGFIAMSGTGSIAGLALAMAAMPELTAGCVIACVDGFGDSFDDGPA